MRTYKLRKSPFFRAISFIVLASFIGLLPAKPTFAQVAYLPMPGAMVSMTPKFDPMVVKGIKFYTNNPFKFDFIVDTGDMNLTQAEIKEQGQKLATYFLASLTTPEKEMWVNLSPYEKSRIIPKSFGDTEMGKELLSEDYMLKQIMATALYPERQLGHEFWAKVYAQAQQQFGTTDVPVSTFNKVWIVPNDAVVYENAQLNSVFVVKSNLKVLMEGDYLAANKHKAMEQYGLSAEDIEKKVNPDAISAMSAKIIKQVVIPALEQEVNTGKNFAGLRQVYQSMILAAWYKKNLKDNVLAQAYVNRNKTLGVDTKDKQITEKIYKQYLKAYRKGVYNYIKEEIDPSTNEIIPRKYFSGGFVGHVDLEMATREQAMVAAEELRDRAMLGRHIFTIAVAALAVGAAFSGAQAATPANAVYQQHTIVFDGNTVTSNAQYNFASSHLGPRHTLTVDGNVVTITGSERNMGEIINNLHATPSVAPIAVAPTPVSSLPVSLDQIHVGVVSPDGNSLPPVTLAELAAMNQDLIFNFKDISRNDLISDGIDAETINVKTKQIAMASTEFKKLIAHNPNWNILLPHISFVRSGFIVPPALPQPAAVTMTAPTYTFSLNDTFKHLLPSNDPNIHTIALALNGSTATLAEVDSFNKLGIGSGTLSPADNFGKHHLVKTFQAGDVDGYNAAIKKIQVYNQAHPNDPVALHLATFVALPTSSTVAATPSRSANYLPQPVERQLPGGRVAVVLPSPEPSQTAIPATVVPNTLGVNTVPSVNYGATSYNQSLKNWAIEEWARLKFFVSASDRDDLYNRMKAIEAGDFSKVQDYENMVSRLGTDAWKGIYSEGRYWKIEASVKPGEYALDIMKARDGVLASIGQGDVHRATSPLTRQLAVTTGVRNETGYGLIGPADFILPKPQPATQVSLSSKGKVLVDWLTAHQETGGNIDLSSLWKDEHNLPGWFLEYLHIPGGEYTARDGHRTWGYGTVDVIKSGGLVGTSVTLKLSPAAIKNALQKLDVKVNDAAELLDKAMNVNPPFNQVALHTTPENGGIDLEKLILNTQGAGVRTAFSDPRVLRLLMDAKGLFPEVQSITPVTVPMVTMLLGLNIPPSKPAEPKPDYPQTAFIDPRTILG